MKVHAYAFEKIGFKDPTGEVEVRDDVFIQFVGYDEDTRLDAADGVIIPQGVFETWERGQMSYDKPRLLAREREVMNLLGTRKWLCFLVQEMRDVFNDITPYVVKSTDLCKRLLSDLGIGWSLQPSGAAVSTKEDAFRPYVERYGVARTLFGLSHSKREHARFLATVGRDPAGFVLYGNQFWIPFHAQDKPQDEAAAQELAVCVVNAVVDYMQKHRKDVPAWANEFEFEAETKAKPVLRKTVEKAKRLREELGVWRARKSILVTTGDTLRDEIVAILRDYFGLNAEPTDEYVEDARIMGHEGVVLAHVETKGSKRGLKRENINQVDSHRERHGLDSATPGLLLINNEMTVAGIEERLQTKMSKEHIAHARAMNVLVMRTIDLLFLMKHLEDNERRGDEFLALLRAGGGWLSADAEGHRIVTA